MFTKELPIQQATEWEVYGDQVALTSKDFEAQLHKYGVNDLFDKKLTIKQDKEKYIFAIDGVNHFAVNTKVDLTTFIDDFYKKLAKAEGRSAEKKAVVEVSELEKMTKVEIIITETTRDLDELAKQIKKNETLAEKTTDLENVKYKVERLLAFYEQERDLSTSEKSGWIFNTKYDRKDKGLRNIHKTELKRRIKELNKIKGQIEQMANNKNKKYTINRKIDTEDKQKKEDKDKQKKETKEIQEVKMDDVNGMDMKTTLKQFSDRIEDLGKEVPDFILTRNDILLEQWDTVPNYEIIVHDKYDARKLIKSLNRINKEYIILNKLELTAAKRQEVSQDLQDLETYLNKVIDNPDTFKPSEHPFVPTHAKEFYELVKLNPTLKAFMQLNNKATNTTDGKIKTETLAGATSETVNETNPTNGNETWIENATSIYDSPSEAFKKWGIGGVLKYGLDQTNMKPHQKQFWWWVGNVAMIGGLAFVGWKMLSSAFKVVFKSNKEKGTGIYDSANLWWLLGPTALIMWSQARSGEGPLSLFKWGVLTEKIGGIFGWSKESDKETNIKYKEGFPGATGVFNGLNYGEMKELLVQDSDGDHMKINPDKYDSLVDMFKNGSKKNPAGAKFLESIGRDDKKNMIDLALKGMGITRETIQDNSNKDKKFNESASKAIARLGSVSTYMEQKWYNKVNTETEHFIEEYIADENADIEDLKALDARGDIFYKETITTDKTGLAVEIKELANGDTEKEEEILLALNSFYEKWPTSNKNIEISWNRPTITFKTYDQTSTINLENKTLTWLTATQEFSSYLETFKAASLTNYIKKVCKDKTAVSDKPFYLSAGKDITFDNADIFSTDFDTEIMTAGWGGALEKVSPTLEENKQAYCDYLNSLKFWKAKTTV